MLNVPGNQALAQNFRVAAVVNDDIISTLDLGSRVEMIVRSSSLPPTNEVRQRIAPQVLRTLIDEQLKLQEAKRLDIAVTPSDISIATSVIEKRNSIPEGQFRQEMESKGVPFDSVMDQIRADIAWNKIVGRRIASQITLDDVEVREATERFRSIMGKPENNYSEIFLSLAPPADRAAVEQLADRLISQVRNGAPFEEVARQFSESGYASEGGQVGWVAPGDTEPEVEEALNRLEPGEIAGPIETLGGLAILRLNGRQMIGGTPAVTIDLSQAIIELPANAGETDIDRARGIAGQIAGQATSCEHFGKLGQQLGSSLSGPLGKLQLREMPTAIASVVGQL
ncbi:MAG: peptidylprolyl isomerase, partial [Rhodospirillales bacterium]